MHTRLVARAEESDDSACVLKSILHALSLFLSSKASTYYYTGTFNIIKFYAMHVHFPSYNS